MMELDDQEAEEAAAFNLYMKEMIKKYENFNPGKKGTVPKNDSRGY